MNILLRTPLAALLIAGLTGCVTTTTKGSFDHLYTASGKCITCINNPITGEPLNHDGEGVAPLGSDEANNQIEATQQEVKVQAAAQEPKYDIHKRTFMVAKNVDIAYIRVKREFNFYNLEQVQAEHGDSAWVVMNDPRFEYESLPSVFYKMRDYRTHNGTGLTIDTEIEKRTESSTQITLRFWLPQGTSDFNKKAIGKDLQQRIIDAINM